MVAICHRSRLRSTGGIALVLSAVCIAACSIAACSIVGCSGPAEDDDEGTRPPPFSGIGANQPGAPAPNNPGAGTPGVGQNGEGNPSNLPVNNTPSGGAPGGNAAGGNAPTGSVPPNGAPVGNVPASGAGGAAGMMAGTAGNGNLPPQNPPAGAAGGVNMPPQMPPVVVPPFVGPGCDGSAFFCEDFEDLAVGTVQASATFTPSTANGTLTIDGAVARGQRSLHVQTQGNGRAYIQLNGFAPPGNSFFARMYVQVQQFPSAPNYAHFTLVEAAGQGAGRVRPIGGQFIQEENGVFWGPGSDAGPTGDWTNWRTTTPAEPGRFVCMEWEMNDADNNINVWIDSQPKPELSVSTNTHGGAQTAFEFPQFNSLWIGWQLYQGGPTPNQFNLWYDDIVFSRVRVGCGQ
jgi:hypothetical protein